MSNKKYPDCGCSKPSSNPSSTNYAEDMNNKAHSKSPYGEVIQLTNNNFMSN